MTNRVGASVFSLVVVAALLGAWFLEVNGHTQVGETSALPRLEQADPVVAMITHRVMSEQREQMVAVSNDGDEEDEDETSSGAAPAPAHEPAPPPLRYAAATGSARSTAVAVDILEQGGNAVDAAIAAAFMVSVTNPYGSGVGGGGIAIVAPADGPALAIDYLAAAGAQPAAASVAVPGFVPGLVELHTQYGELPWEALVTPAAELAASGYEVSAGLTQRIGRSARLRSDDPLRVARLRPGDLHTDPELAATLAAVAADSSTAVTGDLAAAFTAAVDGLTLTDLTDYTPQWRTPLEATLQSGVLHTAPAPAGGASSAAAALAWEQALHQANDTDAAADYAGAYVAADRARARSLADPAFTDADPTRILDAVTTRATPSGPTDLSLSTSDTTHISVVDGTGLTVSMTNTLSEFFGSGLRVRGIFLNNTLDNFNTRGINSWEPGKRPRTFLAPSVLTTDTGARLALGSAGGRRIPSAIGQTVATAAGSQATSEHERWQEAVASPRLHAEGGAVVAEPDMARTIADLDRHSIRLEVINQAFYFGDVHIAGIAADGGRFAISDPRRDGRAAAR